MIGGWLLEPLAYLEKPVKVGPFVRTIERALEPASPAAAA
jgi:hypothetical protein